MSGQGFAASRAFVGPRDRWWSAVGWETGGKALTKLMSLLRNGALGPGDNLVLDDTARGSREGWEGFQRLLVLCTIIGVTVWVRMAGPARVRTIRGADGKLYALDLVPANRCAVKRLYGEQAVGEPLRGDFVSSDLLFFFWLRRRRRRSFFFCLFFPLVLDSTLPLLLLAYNQKNTHPHAAPRRAGPADAA
jgi:hypothetical protein